MFSVRRCLPVGLVCIASVCHGQSVWHVDADAVGGGDGAAWGSAFDDLQSALGVAADGDEIWIAAGLYTPSDTDAAVSFALIDGVSLYGGFFGDETQRAQRDPELYKSILSGDVDGDDIIGSLYQQVGWNSGHIIVASGVSPSTILDGLTVEAGAIGPIGTSAGSHLMSGSGLYSIGGSPTINNCVFQYNRAAFSAGGGMYFRDASPTITNSMFWANSGHLINGGAIALTGSGSVLIEDCEFWWNDLVFSSDSSGGAIYHNSTGPATIRRCVFENNILRPFFSVGNDQGYGGAIASFNAPLLLEDSVFRNNTASTGGAVVVFNDAKVVNCLFDTNHAIARESDFQELGGDGGGLAGYTFVEKNMVVENCTFVNNTSKEHGGVSGGLNANFLISNSIFWNNSGWNPEFVGYFREQIGGGFDLSHCLIPGIFGPPAFEEDLIDPENLPGCIESNPLFVGAGDYALSAGSPAIDAGDNARVDIAVDD